MAIPSGVRYYYATKIYREDYIHVLAKDFLCYEKVSLIVGWSEVEAQSKYPLSGNVFDAVA